ncbi:PAS domain-containing sensor histidine kinase [Consotaella salsifontis]|uniref:Blue-light-activated histidine kinase n=1 Tax=Consotaella salsifontis TaxID=1365950 RepID=A0A1T4SFD4_9HYPH|nr:PAS domain-containing sensor histidine kinase [Consotaella salsifontis]SKA26638.1 Two-component sensor histidine kinase, contains HisKA and HATPase domains [Consotaella salsifontis]
MGAEIRAFDWTTTPLGPISTWPKWLRTTVANLVECGHPIAFWVGPELTTIFNDGFGPILGKRAATALGKPLADVWFDVMDDIRPMVEQAMAGTPVWKEDLPLTMTRNGYPEETWWTFSYSPVRDDEGRIMGFLDTVTETTQSVLARRQIVETNEKLKREVELQQEARRQQRVLQRELSHRMKNTLSMVQAVVSQSLRNAPDPKVAAELAYARITALARAQDVLTSTSWAASDVEMITRASIEPYHDRDERFEVAGPSVELEAQRSLGLALAIHELATNSVKYGALSVEMGAVKIDWNIFGENGFSFSWREVGGPPVEAPSRRGFGSRLTERVVPAYFEGTAALDYAPAGLTYTLSGTLGAGRPSRAED